MTAQRQRSWATFDYKRGIHGNNRYQENCGSRYQESCCAGREESSRTCGEEASCCRALKPINDTFTKASLTIHLAERSGVGPKAAKALLAALEETVLASIHKKGAKEFTLPGLLKVVAQDVPAKKKRFGKDPFTGEDKWFAAKPASVRFKVRPLKKLKDAAL